MTDTTTKKPKAARALPPLAADGDALAADVPATKKKSSKAAVDAADGSAAATAKKSKATKVASKADDGDASAPPVAKRTRSNSITSIDLNVGVIEGDGNDGAHAVAAPKAKKAKKATAVKGGDADEGHEAAEAAAAADPLALENFALSAETVALLKQRGIEKLFPIQAQTFEAIVAGRDVVGQAKTGSGKTLSFSLPVIERMLQAGLNAKRGRGPVAIVMAPTRELAMQIEREISFLCQGRKIASTCIYGGAPYEPQERALREGVDIVIGTPGRIMDHIERGRLQLSAIRYVVLDEADRMLEVGFAEAIDSILGKLYEKGDDDTERPQTLLFSATMPRWVQETSRKYLRKDKLMIDLVGKGVNSVQTSDTIQHYAIRCPYHERASTLRDVVHGTPVLKSSSAASDGAGWPARGGPGAGRRTVGNTPWEGDDKPRGGRGGGE